MKKHQQKTLYKIAEIFTTALFRHKKGTRFIWVFIALGICNFELCVKNQQMDRACQKLNPKIESKGGRVTKNKPEFDFDFRMWVHLAGVVETL